MKLWETYFRLWDRFSHTLTEETMHTEHEGKSIREEERESSYYGYLCDEGVCIESSI
jgi:hypothetical protein